MRLLELLKKQIRKVKGHINKRYHTIIKLIKRTSICKKINNIQ